MSEKRHTCIICGRKRYEKSMRKIFLNSWACSDTKFNIHSYCYEHPDIKLAKKILEDISKIEIYTIKNIIRGKSIVTPELTITGGKL